MTAARDMSSGAIPHPDNYMRHLLPEAAIHQPGLVYPTFTALDHLVCGLSLLRRPKMRTQHWPDPRT